MNSEIGRCWFCERHDFELILYSCRWRRRRQHPPDQVWELITFRGLTQLLIRMVLESVNVRECHLLNAHDYLSSLPAIVASRQSNSKTPFRVNIHRELDDVKNSVITLVKCTGFLLAAENPFNFMIINANWDGIAAIWRLVCNCVCFLTRRMKLCTARNLHSR